MPLIWFPLPSANKDIEKANAITAAYKLVFSGKFNEGIEALNYLGSDYKFSKSQKCLHLLLICYCHMETGRMREAWDYLMRAEALSAGQKELSPYFFRYYQYTNDIKSAGAYFDNFTNKYRADDNIYYLYARVYLEMFEFEKGIEILNRGLREIKKRDKYNLYKILIDLYIVIGDTENAALMLSEAMANGVKDMDKLEFDIASQIRYKKEFLTAYGVEFTGVAMKAVDFYAEFVETGSNPDSERSKEFWKDMSRFSGSKPIQKLLQKLTAIENKEAYPFFPKS